MKSKQFKISACGYLLMLFVSAFGNLYAQQTISGSVTDETGPLPGVTIVEKGTSNGTTSDFDGNFTITVADENSTLVFSYIGFITQEGSCRF
jgi:iron complex outermembrane receptor protein